ncbi:MAG: TlpA disulfide reductase family protein [Bacteroidota bacterium]
MRIEKIIFFTFFFSLSSIFVDAAKCQEVKVVKIDELISSLEKNEDSLFVINFWATWCKPCVKELPCFYEVNRGHKNSAVRVLLVSLDFKRNLNSNLIPFLKKQGEGPETWLLDETDYGSWIDRIDSTWTGSIPATIFINNRKGIRKFHEGDFDCKSLNEEISKLLNH